MISQTIITLLRLAILFIIIYAIVKNLKMLLTIGILIFLVLSVFSYLGYDTDTVISQVLNVTQ